MDQHKLPDELFHFGMKQFISYEALYYRVEKE